ncbi:23S rRNA (cytidine(2498)-2'-O)-methyltransferase RlmM [Marinobacter orientalis]|uniref:Ribosomal RNA large subunit methyltransferase M n=1 Tax=Marinobacter orientalis TaxID=1928859 RepID=A0A7Y0RCY5_9GAMM|nr:23S rRNA (cytidine(2498)-2'-O)-methyltransferase RlmM [Marinobacter orientalis]NMT63961.1 23S rRNA (cytidine(2498)-2'-O)-methyltransferase RlmM [Marinobacter orientalis]TGX50057.1 23S rRNA (cytidine(2498)-2'-O)-methyltransferase RlmM [Marinobacter orientalis]
MERLMVFCRPGFETEAGRELTDAAAALGIYGYFEPGDSRGFVIFNLPGPVSADTLLDTLSIHTLVFVRDWFVVLADVALPTTDRVGAVIDSLKSVDAAFPACARVEVRLPENNSDPDLGNFARKWVSPLSRGLRGAGLLQSDPQGESPARLELLLLGFDRVIAGVSMAGNRARFVSGIPRLRLPASAPSRSALKLEEAWKVFLPPGNELDYLGGGKQAVDLGAAPGGWTWQLVKQGMMVTAVDNGPMNGDLMASGHVRHVEADGYQWRPRRGVDWMVCDIVDHPRRTAALAVDWLTAKLCRYTVFNLKLPMKKRYDEWLICRDILEQGLAQTEMNFRIRARHLYHDREEITCFIERVA